MARKSLYSMLGAANVGGAYSSSFDGLTSNATFSISLWFKTNGSMSASYGAILDGGQFGANPGWCIYMDSVGCIRFTWAVSSTDGGFRASQNYLDDSAWHHVLAVYKADGTSRLFIDATEITDGMGYGHTNYAGWTAGVDGVGIGRRAVGASDYDFPGYIDDVAIFAGDVSSSVVGLQAGSVDPSSLSPIALWRFEEGTGTTVNDASTLGYFDATLAASWSTVVPKQLAGYLTALDTFSGTNGTPVVYHSMILGIGWTKSTDVNTQDFILQSNRAQLPQSSSGLMYTYVGQTDYTILAPFVYTSTSNDHTADASIVFRFKNVSNFWLASVVGCPNEGGINAKIVEVVNGVAFTRAGPLATGYTWAEANTRAMQVDVVGTEVSFLLDGVEVLNYASMSTCLEQTAVGLYGRDLDSVGAYSIDLFMAQDPPASPPPPPPPSGYVVSAYRTESSYGMEYFIK